MGAITERENLKHETRDAVPDGIVRVDVGDREERRLPERICAHSRRSRLVGYV